MSHFFLHYCIQTIINHNKTKKAERYVMKVNIGKVSIFADHGSTTSLAKGYNTLTYLEFILGGTGSAK